MKILFLIVLANFACTTTNKNFSENSLVKSAVAKSENEKQEIIIDDINVQRKFDKTDEEMRFKIKNITQKDDALVVEVQYSGGCVDNHVFELYSTGKPDENGVIDMFLLHKTKGDLCKMMVMQPRVFDISKLSNRKNFTTFRINGSEIFIAVKSN